MPSIMYGSVSTEEEKVNGKEASKTEVKVNDKSWTAIPIDNEVNEEVKSTEKGENEVTPTSRKGYSVLEVAILKTEYHKYFPYATLAIIFAKFWLFFDYYLQNDGLGPNASLNLSLSFQEAFFKDTKDDLQFKLTMDWRWSIDVWRHLTYVFVNFWENELYFYVFVLVFIGLYIERSQGTFRFVVVYALGSLAGAMMLFFRFPRLDMCGAAAPIRAVCGYFFATYLFSAEPWVDLKRKIDLQVAYNERYRPCEHQQREGRRGTVRPMTRSELRDLEFDTSLTLAFHKARFFFVIVMLVVDFFTTVYYMAFTQTQTLNGADMYFLEDSTGVQPYDPESVRSLVNVGFWTGFILGTVFYREKATSYPMSKRTRDKVEANTKWRIATFVLVVMLVWSLVVQKMGTIRGLKNLVTTKVQIGWMPGEEETIMGLIRRIEG